MEIIKGRSLRRIVPTCDLGLIKRIGYAFVPQLIRTTVFHDPIVQPAARKPINPTAYLSGLRGIAAIVVCRGHFLKNFTTQLWLGYDPSGSCYYIDLPIVSLFFYGGGRAPLPMIFLVSGYFNSLKFLQLMRQNNVEGRAKMFHMFASSVPRRLFRLYLPCVVMTIIVAILAHLGLYEFMASHKKDFLRLEQHPIYESGLWQQLSLLFNDWLNMLNFFQREAYYPVHNPHLWTMAFEFRSAIVMYISLLSISRATNIGRLVMLLLIAAFLFVTDQWPTLCFLAGTCIAQLDVALPVRQGEYSSDAALPTLLKPGDLLSEKLEHRRFNWKPYMRYILLTMGFLLAGWLVCTPKNGTRESWGYHTLLRILIPEFCADTSIIAGIFGIILFVLTLRHCSPRSPVMRLLNCATVQYLANHTFAIYLVHGPWLHLYGYYIPLLVWRYLDREYLPSWLFGLCFGFFINICVILSLADIWAREVDARCARAVGIIDALLFPKSQTT